MVKKKPKSETAEILEIVNFIKDRMMTREEGASKEDIVRVEERLYSIEQELKDIKRRLTNLEDEFGAMNSRYKKEIEELWKHVAAIEKRLKTQR